MKPLLLLLLIALGYSCAKNKDNEEGLSTVDAAASAGIATELNQLAVSTTNLQNAISPAERHHWDSSFHHHDSLHWVHHSHYNTGNHHPHNDHHHEWVPYDPNINHHHHYHPIYPGHPHDTIVVVPNHHHTTHHEYHPGIHGLHDHHLIDSLHHIHAAHHP
jgi:hypothetical protein